MSNLVDYAEAEMRAANLYHPDADYGGMIPKAVMELVKVFSDQDHSGFSASRVMSIFKKVANFEPLRPLTGEDDEWGDIFDDDNQTVQNNRCSHVFKDMNTGEAYDINGIIFTDKDGGSYTGFKSRVPVTFPYTPTRRYVDDFSLETLDQDLKEAFDAFTKAMEEKLTEKAEAGFTGWDDPDNADTFSKSVENKSILRQWVNSANYSMFMWHLARKRDGK